MSRQILEEPDARVDRYCAGRMSPEEQERFEEHLVGDAQLAQQVAITLRLRAGLAELERTQNLDGLLRPQSRTRFLPLAAAASLLIIVAGGLLYRTMTGAEIHVRTSLAEIAAGTPGVPQVSTHLLIGTRGADEEHEIVVPGSAQVIALRVLPDQPATSGRYRVWVASAAGQARGSGTAATADREGFVQIYIEARRLQPGSYQVTLGPADGNAGSTTRYRFRLAYQ